MLKEEDLSKQYQKKSDKQHVLDNPDTYIGSIEKVDTMYISLLFELYIVSSPRSM